MKGFYVQSYSDSFLTSIGGMWSDVMWYSALWHKAIVRFPRTFLYLYFSLEQDSKGKAALKLSKF